MSETMSETNEQATQQLGGDAISKIQQMTVAAAKSQITTIKETGRLRYYNPASGTDIEIEPVAPQRMIHVCRAEDIPAVIVNYGITEAFFGLGGVSGICPSRNRPGSYDMFEMALTPTSRLATVLTLKLSEPKTHTQVMRMFEFDLQGCVTVETIDKFRKVSFFSAVDKVSEIDRARINSGGRETHELRDAKDFLRSFDVKCPMFVQMFSLSGINEFSIPIYVEVDLARHSFAFQAYPDMINETQQLATEGLMKWVTDALKAEKCKCKCFFASGEQNIQEV